MIKNKIKKWLKLTPLGPGSAIMRFNSDHIPDANVNRIIAEFGPLHLGQGQVDF